MNGLLQSRTKCFRTKAFVASKPAGTRSIVSVSASATASVTAPCTSPPSPAQTARSVLDISNEGTLSTLTSDGLPFGTNVSFTISKQGEPSVMLAPDSLELINLKTSQRCSLLVQSISNPARAVAAVSLVGSIDTTPNELNLYPFIVEKAMYFGGFDGTSSEVSAEELKAAEPDVLTAFAAELIKNWNSERAEDIYRIVCHFLDVPLNEMMYAELLWIDAFGMYARVETTMQDGPSVVRVPFYRRVLDERDARSVITMAAQVAWEAERNYTPPPPKAVVAVEN